MFSVDLEDMCGSCDTYISGLAIVCDGVTDVMNDERIRDIYQESGGSSAELVRAAYLSGSLDNVSAGCILFSQRVEK